MVVLVGVGLPFRLFYGLGVINGLEHLSEVLDLLPSLSSIPSLL